MTYKTLTLAEKALEKLNDATKVLQWDGTTWGIGDLPHHTPLPAAVQSPALSSDEINLQDQLYPSVEA